MYKEGFCNLKFFFLWSLWFKKNENFAARAADFADFLELSS